MNLKACFLSIFRKYLITLCYTVILARKGPGGSFGISGSFTFDLQWDWV